LGMRGDRPLPDLGLPVAGELPVLLLAELAPELAVHSRALRAELTGGGDASRGVDAEARVVDRDHPADRLHLAERPQARARHDAMRPQPRLGDAVEDLAVLELAHAGRLRAARRRVELHFRHHAHRRHELVAAEAAVQDRHVIRIHQILVVLQPVARHDDTAARTDARIVGLERFAPRQLFHHVLAPQHGPLVRGPHEGEDEAVALLDGIPGLAHGVAVLRAALGLARLIEAVAVDVVQPAVIAAADAALLD